MPDRPALAVVAPLVVIVALAWLVASPGWAQNSVARSSLTSEDDRTRIAETHHQAAVAAFARGRYRDAIASWLEANLLRPSAAISFNIARSYEQLDHDGKAVAWYRDYLQQAEQPSDHGKVTRRVKRLEKQIALNLPRYDEVPEESDLPSERARDLDQVLAPTPSEVPAPAEAAAGEQPAVPIVAPAPTPPIAPVVPVDQVHAQPEFKREIVKYEEAPKQEGASTLTVLGVVALGTGAVALGFAVAFEVLRSHAEHDARTEATQIRFADDIETMHARRTTARVFGGVGAGLVATGGGLLLWAAHEDERAPGARVALSCPRSRCGASFTGRF